MAGSGRKGQASQWGARDVVPTAATRGPKGGRSRLLDAMVAAPGVVVVVAARGAREGPRGWLELGTGVDGDGELSRHLAALGLVGALPGSLG